MTLDTVFDCASMTKVLATTPAIMQLWEKGKFRMSDRVAKYLPEFGQNGKQDITIRQLLVHYSGLAPDLDLLKAWEGKETAYRVVFLFFFSSRRRHTRSLCDWSSDVCSSD